MRTITTLGFDPVIVVPDTLIEFVTNIAAYDGTLAGGDELVPPIADHVPPQDVGPLGLVANPLNWLGVGPPLR